MKPYNNYSKSSCSKSYNQTYYLDIWAVLSKVLVFNLINFVKITSHSWYFKNGTLLALKMLLKNWQIFWKKWFLAIFSKFGTIWQPWLRWKWKAVELVSGPVQAKGDTGSCCAGVGFFIAITGNPRLHVAPTLQVPRHSCSRSDEFALRVCSSWVAWTFGPCGVVAIEFPNHR